jgi:hypothetical protein
VALPKENATPQGGAFSFVLSPTVKQHIQLLVTL